MPSIDHFVQKDIKKKKFQKVAHRPWTVITTDIPEEIDDSLRITEHLNEETSRNVIGVIEDAAPSPVNDFPAHVFVPEPENKSPAKVTTFEQSFAIRDEKSPEIATDLLVNNSETIGKQFRNSSKTIQEQFPNNSGTIPKQFRNNSRTIPEQFQNNSRTNKPENGPRLVNVLETIGKQSVNNSETIGKQIPVSEGAFLYARLVGFQKHLFLYIAKRCMQHESLSSGPIFKQDFKEYVSEDLDTVKTTLQRLISKGFIKREQSKSGAGGFSVFSITEDIKNMLQNEIDSETIGKQLVNNSRTIHKQSDLPSSSSYIYKKTTTTNADLFTDCLPIVYQSDGVGVTEQGEGPPTEGTEDLEKIDTTPLAFIGFSRQHLQQLLKRSELTPEMINDSIQAFAFDLQHNNVGEKIKTHPLNFFMGILRMNQPYAAPSNFQDPKVLAMRKYLEQKKLVREERKKVEEEIFQFAYEEWAESLTDDQVAEIIPETRHREYPMREGFLKNHFRAKIFDKTKMAE